MYSKMSQLNAIKGIEKQRYREQEESPWELVLDVEDFITKIAYSIEGKVKEHGRNSGIEEHVFDLYAEPLNFQMEWESEAIYDCNFEYAHDFIVDDSCTLSIFDFKILNPEMPLFTFNGEGVVITDGIIEYSTWNIGYLLEERLKELL